MGPAQTEHRLIPPPMAIRIELARSVRESKRLRELLKVSVRADEDRQFIEAHKASLPRTEGVGA